MRYSKLPVDENEPSVLQDDQSYRPSWHRKVVALVLVATFCLTNPWAPTLPYFTGKHHKCHHGTQYKGEKISWQKAGEIEGRHLETSSIVVPMDQFNLTNSGDKTFNISLIRLRGKDGSPNLLLNPGGPGGKAMTFVRPRVPHSCC